MTEVPMAPPSNGATPVLPHAERLVADLRSLIADRTARRDELEMELHAIAHELKAYEKSLAPLIADPHAPPTPRKKRGRPKGEKATPGTRVGPEKMARFEAAA